jgi:hypothetical protein
MSGSQGPKGTIFGSNGQTALTERSTGNDGDGDGFTEEDGDCDDTDSSVHPDAEPCCPGEAGFCTVEDRNCNGLADGQFDCANSPIIIDIRGNGLDLTDREGGVTFDFFASGVPINMAWIARDSDDVFLVLDRNRDGRIDNGSELFGNRTPLAEGGLADNGFEALAEYDLKSSGGNENGFIESGDRIYSQLRVWQDVNHNGVSEPGELKTLTAAGIQGLDIDYTSSRKKDRYGNEFRYRSTALVAGEKKPERRTTYDVFFVTR